MSSSRWAIVVGALALGVAIPGTAGAHLERPSYWPDPAPDTAVSPPAGGAVPKARSLSSAVSRTPSVVARPGDVRVVCQGKRGATSIRLAQISIRRAQRDGFRVRPSQPVVRYTAKQARTMLSINRKLRDMCRFKTVQAAVTASGNNDRIVIMPGLYTEPQARKQPTNDERCRPLLQRDASGSPTPSYEYQVICPHDQNLVYLQGREVTGKPLSTPRSDRRGIPKQELGACVRCNVQIEGSGPQADDVIIDAGKDYAGSGPEARPGGHAKDVVLRVDRGDGFVGRNFLMRGAREHGFYTEETDGVLLDRTKFFWNADYGHLAFTSDHQLIQNCDGMGAGDAALYPGASPETGAQATDFYPDAPRMNTTVRRCDMRNSALGYSGSMGNAVRITENHIYGNTAGIASDTLSSSGHPGFPADSSQIDNNFIYANNFNVYSKDSPVKPLITVPIGTGVVYAGMNSARVHNNWFFDNWRFGTMLFAVPDALTSFGGPEGDVFPGVACAGAPGNGISTSCGNNYHDNRMGQVPPGFTYPAKLDEYKVPHGDPTREQLPNGTDFWWDEFPTNTGNCWYDNVGRDGTKGSVSGPGDAGRSPALPPNILPDCAGGENPAISIGLGDVAKEQYLLTCAEGPNATGPLPCDWYEAPTRPGSAQAAARSRAMAEASKAFARTPQAAELRARMQELAAAGASG